MAIDVTPGAWLANWSEDGTDITLPIASVTKLTAAEADATTGDIRKVLFALLDEIWVYRAALAAADVPVQMTINKSTQVNTTTGIHKHTYTFVFNNEVASEDVADES